MLVDEDVKKVSHLNNESESHYYSQQQQKHQKLIHPTGEPKPSILNYTCENLSVSQSNMERGFNKQSLLGWQIINRHTVLNMCTIILAISCIFVEIFKLPKVLENSRNIDTLKRDLEALQRQFYEENFLNEFKALEQQLYDGGIDDTSSDDDTELNGGSDYDNNYDDDGDYESDSRQNVSEKQIPGAIESRILSTSLSTEEKDVGEGFDDMKELREHNEQFHRNMRKNSTAVESTRLSMLSDSMNNSLTINETGRALLTDFPNTRPKREIAGAQPSTDLSSDDEVIAISAHQLLHTVQKAKTQKYLKKKQPAATMEMASTVRKRRQYHKVSDEAKKLIPRVPAKRNLRIARQIFAAHYGADSDLFTNEDEHTGNGRFRHNEGIFKAWRPSNWMSDFGMDRHFSLNNDGKLTVHETGLYLIYAQIHYLDEHDENGFHLLVNGRPILQCMVYSPGTGHKSRSCFSAQVTLLHNDDEIILKDVGISRYTLFQQDKSFFGLVKIGDMKHPQMHTPQLMGTDQ